MGSVVKITAVILNSVMFAFWLILGRHTLSEFDPVETGAVIIYAVFVGTPAFSIVALLWRPPGQTSSLSVREP
jgi:hypothetical protein